MEQTVTKSVSTLRMEETASFTCNCSKIDCWHVGGCRNSTWETAGSICDGYVNCFYTFTLNTIYDEFCLKLYLFNIFCEYQQKLKFVVMDTSGIARRQNVYVSELTLF